MDDNGELLETEPLGMAAIGFDCGYDFLVFHEGHAGDEDYVRGFVEGCQERLVDQDKLEEADYLGSLWESSDEKYKRHALEMLKDGCEVREGRFDDRPEFPV